MKMPISMGEAARLVEISARDASVIIRTHQLPTVGIPGAPKFIGLPPRSFERLKKLAERLKSRPQATA